MLKWNEIRDILFQTQSLLQKESKSSTIAYCGNMTGNGDDWNKRRQREGKHELIIWIEMKREGEYN